MVGYIKCSVHQHILLWELYFRSYIYTFLKRPVNEFCHRIRDCKIILQKDFEGAFVQLKYRG